MNWRALPRRALPYLIAAAGGFLLSYAAVFLFAFPAQVLPDDGILPNVVGKTYEDAAGILQKAGFHAQQGEARYHKTIPANIVLQEDPPAGSRQKRGIDVVLALSAGQQTAEAPVTTNMAQPEARTALDQNRYRHDRAASRLPPPAFPFPLVSVRIAPSILSADLSKLTDEIAMLEAGGADWIHIDVMDGRFVPNLTFGAKVIESVRKLTQLPLDVHLMVVEPENYFDDFAAAGANGMSIHTEVSPHLQRQLNRIRELGCRAGAVVNPATPLSAVSEVIPDLDLLLVMTVNPGFGGQEFIKS